MRERLSRGTRDLWLPALVVLLGGVLSAGVWWMLVSDRRAELLETTREIASGTGRAVFAELKTQQEALTRLASRWARTGQLPPPEWRAEADVLLATRSGLTRLAWIDLDQPGRSVAAGDPDDPEATALDAREARLHHDRAYIAGPKRDASGALAYRVQLPLRTVERHTGVLIAHVHLHDLLRPLVRARARGYALRIDWDGQPIFSRGSPSDDAWQSWWHSEAEIPLPLGGSWRLVLRPTPELAAALLTPTPHYLLAAGLFLSLLLGGLTHQWRLTSRQARFLAASNRALEERSSELRRLNAELEERVAARTEELEDAVAELEAFNYSVSHDLRSPLGAILNFASILEEDYRGQPLGSGGAALIERIRRSALRATALLQDLLNLSRAGRALLELEMIDMTSLAKETFAQECPSEVLADVEFVVDPLPPVEGDRTLIGQVFTNLFSNALKYSRGREKCRVWVSGRVEGDECIYEVTDNGRGFDMRYATKLFGLFERLHNEDDIEGTGVGLAVVARIVKRHRGRVWAEGEVEGGACFCFALPRSAETG